MYTVFVDSVIYTCKARGLFRNKKGGKNITPLIGDRVEISVTDCDKKTGVINKILPRKNELIRPPVSNIDQVIITMATAQPAFNSGLLDRFLVLVAYEDIPVLICVNKSDIQAKDDSFAPYVNAGYPLVYTSTIARDGLGTLIGHMAGKTSVFAGPSGVGKSSLINALSPKLELETGELSTKLNRGKHTTRHSEIFPLDKVDGFCVDTPGFSSLEVANIPKNMLGPLFREFEKWIPNCRFSDCLHDRERDCAVKEQLGKSITNTRYESYIKILQS